MDRKPYSFEKFELVHNLSFTEKVVEYFLKAFGYSFGYLSLLHRLSSKGLKISDQGYRIQTYHCFENNEVVYRRREAKDKLLCEFKNLQSVKEVFRDCIKKYRNKNCMGERYIIKEVTTKDDKTGKEISKMNLSKFKWSTYQDVYEEVLSVSTCLLKLNLNQENKIVLFGETCKDWMVMALSVMEINSTIITIYPTLSDASLEYCLKLTEPTVLYGDYKTMKRIKTILPKVPSIKTLLFSPRDMKPNEIEEYESKEDIKCINLETFKIFKGTKSSLKTNLEKNPLSNDVAIIMFTSGTTGEPKGVVITHGNFIAILGGVCHNEKYWSDHTYPAYLPLSHILEFSAELAVLSFGGKIGYCRPTTLLPNTPGLGEKCISDVESLRPTIMFVVPLILERISKLIKEKLEKESRIKKLIIQTLYNIRSHFVGRGYDTPIINKAFFRKLRALFGGNIRYGMIGGAILSRETDEFINICFGTFKQAYGTTELCCGATFSEIDYYRPNNVGPPIGCAEIKLVPWEEGGYSPSCPVRPAGEIVVHGPHVSKGYYKNEEETKAAFKKDPITNKTWFYTGDIAEILADGTFRIIDRKKDFIKLTHGEFVALAPIENDISKSQYVDMVCVVPDAKYSILIALIIPNRASMQNLMETEQRINKEITVEEIILASKTEEIVLKDIGMHMTSAKRTKFEIPSKIHLLVDIWTPESGLLTPTMKLKRREISQKYNHLLAEKN